MMVVMYQKQSFFPRVTCLYQEPQPQKPQLASHHRPKTPSTENSNPKTTQFETPTPNHQKWDKNVKTNPGKNTMHQNNKTG